MNHYKTTNIKNIDFEKYVILDLFCVDDNYFIKTQDIISNSNLYQILENEYLENKNAEINGSNTEQVISQQINEPTNAEIAQSIEDLKIDLLIAGIIE